MDKRSRKIDKIVSLASAEEKRHSEITGRSQQTLNDHLHRLGELSAHRHNYASKATSAAEIHSAHWKDYQNFLYRLDDAVRAQRSIVSDCEQDVELHRRRWMVKRQRLESLERVLERYQNDERIAANRREQRVLDDLVTTSRQFADD